MPISMSYASNRRVPVCRMQLKKPSVLPLATIGSTIIDTSDSRLATGLRRHARASLRAASGENACSRTGLPDSMHRTYGDPSG